MDKIDNLDKKILSILSKNARIPFKDVAAECGVSRAAIHQRVQHLIQGGVITGSGFDVNPKSIGYTTCTYVGLNLERASMYKNVVERLMDIPEIVECHFTTGPYTMLIKLYARDNNSSWTSQQQDADDSGRGFYGDSYLARPKHQTRNSSTPGRYAGRELMRRKQQDIQRRAL